MKIVTVGLALVAAASLTFALAQRRAARRTTPTVSSAPDTQQGPRTITVKAQANFQRALDTAQPGDTILLEAGATFTGPFTLPYKKGTGTDADWITVRSAAPDASLPAPGQRITPAASPLMPKLVAPGQATMSVRTAPGAHHYRFIGVEFLPINDTADVRNIVWLSDDTDGKQLDQQPHHITLDRCYIHGHPASEQVRGVALNGANLSVINSYISEIHHSSQDSQAVWGATGPGPFLIENNYLEAAGENLMFGGTDSPIVGLVPTDITIRHNHFFKPWSWRQGDPAFNGHVWAIKNLLEIKNGQRILIEGNLFENSWRNYQTGVGVVLKATNQYGATITTGGYWNTCRDVVVRYNVIRHVATAFQLGNGDNNNAGNKHIQILDNLAYDISRVKYAENAVEGCFIGTDILADDVLIEHNTVVDNDFKSIRLGDDHFAARKGLVIRNNVLARGNNTGIGLESNTTEGLWALKSAFGDTWEYRRNLLFNAGLDYAQNPVAFKYPTDNFFTPQPGASIFIDMAGGNYRLKPNSPYKGKGTDKRDPGCDIDALEAAMSNSIAAQLVALPAPAPAQRPRRVRPQP